MERARQIANSWAWLPAFRAVAETEHLPSASEALHITPSALSRTIRLLEDELERPLFDRVGRRLKLNPAGEALLSSVRRAMREVHEAYVHLQERAHVGAIHIGAPGPFAPLYVLPALATVAEEHPGLEPQVHAASGVSAQAALKRGDLDVVVADDAIDDPDLEQRVIRTLEHDVFKAEASDEGIDALPFVAPPTDGEGRNRDAWPDERPRRVGLRVDRMAVAIDAVRQGPWVAALPVDVGEAAGLVRLGVEGLPPTELTLMHRPSLSLPGATEIVAEAIQAHLL